MRVSCCAADAADVQIVRSVAVMCALVLVCPVLNVDVKTRCKVFSKLAESRKTVLQCDPYEQNMGAIVIDGLDTLQAHDFERTYFVHLGRTYCSFQCRCSSIFKPRSCV